MNEPKKHILLVEDEENFGSLLKNYLELSNYAVEWAHNGDLGYNLMIHRSFDLCILDVMMPRRDGFTLAEDIRKINREMPIVFLTARGEKEDQVRGYKIGADDYITKPFDSELLLLKIQSILKRSQHDKREIPHCIALGFYVFEPAKRSLSLNGEQIRLSPKETQLLAALCRYPNEVMPRKKVLLEIWKNDDYFATRSMDVYIAKLRKYLKQDPRIRIESIHGNGFLFEVPGEVQDSV